MKKSLTDLYNEYTQRHNGKPKHDFGHFIRVMSMIDHHKTYIRPKIEWWSNVSYISDDMFSSIYECGKCKLVSNEHKEHMIKNGMLDIIVKHINLFIN
jgi:hypothetical protein